jgi:hypothetical protein
MEVSPGVKLRIQAAHWWTISELSKGREPGVAGMKVVRSKGRSKVVFKSKEDTDVRTCWYSQKISDLACVSNE